jgi:hypothetical protein
MKNKVSLFSPPKKTITTSQMVRIKRTKKNVWCFFWAKKKDVWCLEMVSRTLPDSGPAHKTTTQQVRKHFPLLPRRRLPSPLAASGLSVHRRSTVFSCSKVLLLSFLSRGELLRSWQQKKWGDRWWRLVEGRIAGDCVGAAQRWLDEGKINCERRRRGRTTGFFPSLYDGRYATKILFCISSDNLVVGVDWFLFVVDPAVTRGFCANFVDPVSSPFNRIDHSAVAWCVHVHTCMSSS